MGPASEDEPATPLLWSKNHKHGATLELGGLFHHSHLSRGRGDLGEHGLAQGRQGDFPAPENAGDLDLVFLGDELQDMSNLGLKVVLACLGSHLDFLELDNGLLLLGLLLLLRFLVLEPAKIHDFADRRRSVGRDFNQVEVEFACRSKGLMQGQYAELIPFRVYYPNLFGSYFSVYVDLVSASYAFLLMGHCSIIRYLPAERHGNPLG